MQMTWMVIAMSKKKDRAWFVCPQWADMMARHYANDAEAGQALKADPKVPATLRFAHTNPASLERQQFDGCRC